MLQSRGQQKLNSTPEGGTCGRSNARPVVVQTHTELSATGPSKTYQGLAYLESEPHFPSQDADLAGRHGISSSSSTGPHASANTCSRQSSTLRKSTHRMGQAIHTSDSKRAHVGEHRWRATPPTPRWQASACKAESDRTQRDRVVHSDMAGRTGRLRSHPLSSVGGCRVGPPAGVVRRVRRSLPRVAGRFP